MTSKFTFPPIYSFPPFYTKQPNIQTYATQVEHWRRLVTDYCRFYKVWGLSLSGLPLGEDSDNGADDGADDGEDAAADDDFETAQASLFQNSAINRSLKNDFILDIYNQMIANGEADWADAKNHRHGVLVYWHSLEEWSNIIGDWIANTGQEGSVLTLYELRKGELSQGQEFAGMNETMLVRVLQLLNKQGRCSFLKDSDGNLAGVKFN